MGNKYSDFKGKKVVLHSIIKCPECGYEKEDIMPLDVCQFFYECENCNKVLKPKNGECCVFCSYGNEKCPPIQAERGCCG